MTSRYGMLLEAREEDAQDRHGFEVTHICGGCEEVLDALYDERTDEPWFDLEPCETCGAKDWLDG
jgi:hypothetical protein